MIFFLFYVDMLTHRILIIHDIVLHHCFMLIAMISLTFCLKYVKFRIVLYFDSLTDSIISFHVLLIEIFRKEFLLNCSGLGVESRCYLRFSWKRTTTCIEADWIATEKWGDNASRHKVFTDMRIRWHWGAIEEIQNDIKHSAFHINKDTFLRDSFITVSKRYIKQFLRW